MDQLIANKLQGYNYYYINDQDDDLTEKSFELNPTQFENVDDHVEIEEKSIIKVENNFGSDGIKLEVESIACEMCGLKFSEKNYSSHNNMKSALRFHYYVKHFKKHIDVALENSNNSQCPLENCSYSSQNLPNLIRHFIGKQHGILDKLIANELVQENENIDEERDISTENISTENMPTENISTEKSREKNPIEFENENSESIACEICDFEISKEKYNKNYSNNLKYNMKRDLRFHYYVKHFKNHIDKALEESKSQCPFENCLYSSDIAQNLLRHYIAKQHGILDKLITNELQENNKNNIEEQDDIFTEKSKKENNPTTELFENENNFDDVDDEKSEKRRGSKSVICELCGFEFSREKYGANMFNIWRMHLYEKHFKKNINKAVLKSESFTRCPIETCNFRTKTPMKINIVKHYIGKQHGILENLVANEIQHKIRNDEDEDQGMFYFVFCIKDFVKLQYEF